MGFQQSLLFEFCKAGSPALFPSVPGSVPAPTQSPDETGPIEIQVSGQSSRPHTQSTGHDDSEQTERVCELSSVAKLS
jgi:hypothetical protein